MLRSGHDYDGDDAGVRAPGPQPWLAPEMCKEKLCKNNIFLIGITVIELICVPVYTFVSMCVLCR